MIVRDTKNGRRQRGMTLLEILLYISISAAVIFAASGLLSIIFEVKQKGQIIQAVEEEGALISYTLEGYIHNARHVYSPEIYKQGDKMTLLVTTDKREAIISVFALKGILYAIIDNGEKVALTSNAVTVIEPNFIYAGSSERGFISYSFTLSGADASGKNNYKKSFIGGVSLR